VDWCLSGKPILRPGSFQSVCLLWWAREETTIYFTGDLVCSCLGNMEGKKQQTVSRQRKPVSSGG